MNMPTNKSNVNAFLLCSFLGIFGIHRFYVGKYFTGILQLLTLGGLFFWTIIDWFMIIKEKFTDYGGEKLTWEKDKTAQYAGFMVRFAAHIIDGVIILAVLFLIGLAFVLISFICGNDLLTLFITLDEVIKLTLTILYIVLLTASVKQATIGKRIVGVIVVDHQMQRLSKLHSLGRCLAYFFSYLTLGIGFLMIAFTKKHTGLHDIIAGTYVIYSRK